MHWRFDGFAVNEAGEIDLTQNIGGVRLGIDIANDIATNGRTAAAAADVNAEPDPADVLREVDTAGDVPKVA